MLNEQAFSLFLLLRDRCGGDLVGFIDQTLSIAAEQPDSIIIAREALLAAFTSIAGVSRKLAGMMLAMILMSPADRPDWHAVGKSMVAVDSLVHNWLHRTGILRAYGAEHLYGQRCFSAGGCEWVINDLVDRLQASSRDGSGEVISPRELEHAIWRFCAADELAICNGNNIRDNAACQLESCLLWASCGRVPLRPRTAPEAS